MNPFQSPYGPIHLSADALAPLTMNTDDTVRGSTRKIAAPSVVKGWRCGCGRVKNCVCEQPSTSADLVNTTVGSAPRRASMLGVVLGIQNDSARLLPPVEGGGFDAAVCAEIVFGIGGASFTVQCDWLSGTQVAMVAENVRVTAHYEERALPWAEEQCDPCPPCFTVSAGVGYQQSGRNSNPARRTVLAAIEQPAAIEDIPFPDYAISFTVLPITGTIGVKQVGRGTLLDVPYSIASPLSNAGQHDVENAFPRRNGARVLRVRNEGMSGPAAAWIVFGLAL